MKIIHYFLYSAIYALVYIGSSQPSHATQYSTAIEGEYIVVYHSPNEKNLLSINQRKNYAREISQRLASSFNTELLKTFGDTLDGVLMRGAPAQINALRLNPNVRYILPNVVIQVNPGGMTQVDDLVTPLSWGLDRIDQREALLNNSYHYDYDGTGITAYVLDTGVNINHQEFSGRASSGYNAVDNNELALDCHGHGTHVAGILGGEQHGVAKNVNIVAVKALDCDGAGSIANIIDSIDWVVNNAQMPAVVNISAQIYDYIAVDEAVARLIASGVHVIGAAGNNNNTACSYSPGRLPGVINVGATTISDERADYSNYGYCVDIFAPGSDIPSANYATDDGIINMSGTSMAAPHVAGIAALYLEENSNLSTNQLRDLIKARASSQLLTGINSDSPNRLAFSLVEAEEDCITNCPTPTVPPTILVENTPLVISSAENQRINFQIEIPERAINLTFTLQGGTGDIDLYVKYLTPPDINREVYDCISFYSGNNERCTFASPAIGTWYLTTEAFFTSENAILTVTYDREPETPVVSQYTVTKDVFVRGGDSSDRNFDRSFLLAQASSPADTRLSYIAFDFDNNQLSDQNTLLLRLNVKSTNKVARLRIRETENNWTVGDISYNNQPEIYDDSIYIDVSKADAFEWIEVDISPFLEDGNFSGSIVISNETNGAYTALKASESDRAPSLQLTSNSAEIRHAVPATSPRILESTDSTFVQGGYFQDRVLNINRMILNTGYNPQNAIHGLINYDLNSINIEPSSQIFVRFRFDRLPYNVDITLQEVSTNWNEDNVTWNTQPTNINNKTVTQSIQRNEYHWVDVDVTSLITEGNLTGAFRLSVQAPGSVRVFSSGSRFTPELVITTLNEE
ncbi:S8 family serine peptidase [Pelagibaculum spongiae]|uniref:Peptidase S8/S53 domain-containing protein n=1 Tax=Pelagibaculum spongiae TaxID=2080658 RepID=A0A2V1GZT8_9GAMM|nr:S8 family serine peptidase [Pelagibaculum spongiae]PVZ72246.1 hypothetical protein DC094_04325 [Pelagibaculum spongiae]